jgi:hypothetical protein
MKKKTLEEIAEIKRSNLRYCIKASLCKLKMSYQEYFGELDAAIVYNERFVMLQNIQA